jgi:cyclomaltodextrinase / maltogenic alpha-amylase / neopullulanase
MPEQDLNRLIARKLRKGKLPHVPPAASPVSSLVQLELEAPPEACPEVILTDIRRDNPWQVALSFAGGNLWQTTILLPQEPTIVRYYFRLADGTKIQEHRQMEGVTEPLFGVWEEQDFRIAVYTPKGNPPAWVAGQVAYQIFPDRFAQGDPDSLSKGSSTTYQYEVLAKTWADLAEAPPKGRDFFGGDLRGVINHLGYIHELGITCIYFTPIFESPTNHRYDASNYLKIDPRLGTEADLAELIEKAGAMGIRVLLDGVFNHCSQDSVYFKAARADKLSPYYRWFTFKEWPDKWEGWLDVIDMPEFVECPEVEEFFFGKSGVAQHWLGYGTSGWRTDVTPWITDEWWRRFRSALRRSYPEAYLIAEDWGDATHRLLGDSFDATMNYRFCYSVGGWAGGKLNSLELCDRLETLRRDTPPAQFMAQLNLLGSHDTMRLITRLKGHQEQVKLAVSFMLAYPGVPLIYYGDEIGLEGDYAEDSRRPFPWEALAQKQNLLDFFRKAINTRQTSPALKFGDVSLIYADRQALAILRHYEAEYVLALFNNKASPVELVIPLDRALQGLKWVPLLGDSPINQPHNNLLKLRLPAFGAVWLHANS